MPGGAWVLKKEPGPLKNPLREICSAKKIRGAEPNLYFIEGII
jgi:hypothetical protein